MWTVLSDNGAIYEIENVRFRRDPLYFLTEMGHGVGEMTADIVNVRRTDKNTWFSAYHLNPITGYPWIKKVIFHDPATIVLWNDGTKTVVKCQEGDTYSKEQGLALCIAKKHLGNKSNFNNEFHKWINQ